MTRKDHELHQMTSDAISEFGYSIRQARIGRKWSLEKLAHEALGNGDRKGYVSQVEKGLRNLSPETIDKFDQALDLPDDIIKAAHMAPARAKPTPEDEKLDHDAQRLIIRAAKDENAPQMAETLMIALAYEFAGGKHLDLQTAYTGFGLSDRTLRCPIGQNRRGTGRVGRYDWIGPGRGRSDLTNLLKIPPRDLLTSEIEDLRTYVMQTLYIPKTYRANLAIFPC